MTFPQFLLPETIVHANGLSEPVEVFGNGESLQLTLGITRIVEQQSLEIQIEGSSDGSTWLPKPILTFPQKFYCGTYAMLLPLSKYPDVRFVRARWIVNRWGRGSLQPTFGIYIALESLARDLRPAAISAAATA